MAKRQKPKTSEKAARPIEPVPLEATPTFYTNVVNIEVTNHDVKLRFGLVQKANDEVVQVAPVVSVYMSHSHAHAFAKVLNSVLNRGDLAEAAAKLSEQEKGKTH